MPRLVLAALAAPLLLGGVARAQGGATPTPAPPAAAPAPAPRPGDAAVKEAVREEVERAKQELRDEIRAEVQGLQAERAFMGEAAEEKAKLEFFQLDGYFRFRGDLFDNLDLRRDPLGSIFPVPLFAPGQHGTITSGNLRLRLEPTLNVSEDVRVRAQVDLLDNLVLGSTPEGAATGSTWSTLPFQSTTQVSPLQGVNSDRPAVQVKRVWGEVQTPVGLLVFGRMRSEWGLGILSHAGDDLGRKRPEGGLGMLTRTDDGIDDDFGDTVDRIQFAVNWKDAPAGPLTLIPMLDWIATGIVSQQLGSGAGIGQPFDRDQADDAKALGLKIIHIDTPDEQRRRFEKNQASLNYGAWYSYKSQSWDLGTSEATASVIHRDASAHVLDLWARYLTRRFRLETEWVGVYGQIGNATSDPANPLGPVLLRQFGGTVQTAYEAVEGKLTLGAEVGVASGDRNPGFGNRPGAGSGPNGTALPGDLDGTQFSPDDAGRGRVADIRNFSFNRAYRVDLILWREIIGSVTDAFYLKPTLRWEFLPGLAATLQVIYSQALYAQSTPSTIHTPLGLEGDVGLSYLSDDGFAAWLKYGLLQPLDGLGYESSVGHKDLSRAHALRAGLAVKF